MAESTHSNLRADPPAANLQGVTDAPKTAAQHQQAVAGTPAVAVAPAVVGTVLPKSPVVPQPAPEPHPAETNPAKGTRPATRTDSEPPLQGEQHPRATPPEDRV